MDYKKGSNELTFALLDSYIDDAKAANKDDFYKLGQYYGVRYASNPALLVKDAGFEAIIEDYLGKLCDKCGRKQFRQSKEIMTHVIFGNKSALEKKLKNLGPEITSEFFKSITAFNIGFYTGAQKVSLEYVQEYVNTAGRIWRAFMGIPQKNGHAVAMLTLAKKKKLDEMIELYDGHKEDIDEEHPDAEGLIQHLKLREKK